VSDGNSPSWPYPSSLLELETIRLREGLPPGLTQARSLRFGMDWVIPGALPVSIPLLTRCYCGDYSSPWAKTKVGCLARGIDYQNPQTHAAVKGLSLPWLHFPFLKKGYPAALNLRFNLQIMNLLKMERSPMDGTEESSREVTMRATLAE